MASRRAHPAAIAAASDGSVLINLVELLPDAVQEALTKRLGAHVFVGVPLSEGDATSVVARMDGAAAEASAHLLGARSGAPRRSGKKTARKRR